MRRISILIALSICLSCHVMADNVLKHDTTTIQTASPSQLHKEKTEKKFIKPEVFGFKIKNIDVPKDYYNFITDDSCENICFLSADSTADNTKKKKKQSILMTVKRISDNKLLYRKTFPWKGQKYILSKTSLTELLSNNTTITDFATTAQLFEQKGVHSYMGYVNNKLLLCSHSNLTDKVKITAYSLTTGQEVWQQKKLLNNDNGMTTCQPIDEVSDYVVSGDLIRVNWETGDIKRLESKTSIANQKKVLSTIFIGAATGIVGGMMGLSAIYYPVYNTTLNNNYRSFFYMPSPLKIGGLNSYVIQNSGKNYFADRNSLYCFDDDMNETWKIELPEKATRSELFLKGDTICMVNLALAIYGNGGAKAMEKPYVATFSATDGKLFSYQPMEMENQNVISCISSNDQLHLLFPNREAIYNTTSNKMDFFDTDTTLIGSFKYYIDEGQLFKVDTDNSFSEIKPTRNTVPIRTNKGYVVDVKNGKPTVLATPTEAYRTIASHDDMTFIVGQRGKFMELWLLKNGEAALISDRLNSIRTKSRHLILCLDNGKIQILSY